MYRYGDSEIETAKETVSVCMCLCMFVRETDR